MADERRRAVIIGRLLPAEPQGHQVRPQLPRDGRRGEPGALVQRPGQGSAPFPGALRCSGADRAGFGGLRGTQRVEICGQRRFHRPHRSRPPERPGDTADGWSRGRPARGPELDRPRAHHRRETRNGSASWRCRPSPRAELQRRPQVGQPSTPCAGRRLDTSNGLPPSDSGMTWSTD